MTYSHYPHSQVYEIAATKETGGTHEGGQRQKQPDANSDYGVAPISVDIVDEGQRNVNKKFSLRDPAEVRLNQVLRKENAARAKENEYLQELVKLQGKVTNGTKFTQTSVRRIAKELMQKAGAKGNYLELAEILNGIYESIASAKEDQELNWGEGDEAAQWLMEHIEIKPDRGEYANDK